METCAYCTSIPLFRDHESGAYLCPMHAWLLVGGPREEAPRPPLTIRPAAPGDYAQILDLATYFWGETKLQRFGRDYTLDALPAFVACDEDVIVGVASYTCAKDCMWVVSLNVLPRWQGRGGVTRLLSTLIQEAQDQRLGRIAITVSNDNLPALDLYQRMGFEIVEVRVGCRMADDGGCRVGFDGIPVRDEIQLQGEINGQ